MIGRLHLDTPAWLLLGLAVTASTGRVVTGTADRRVHADRAAGQPAASRAGLQQSQDLRPDAVTLRRTNAVRRPRRAGMPPPWASCNSAAMSHSDKALAARWYTRIILASMWRSSRIRGGIRACGYCSPLAGRVSSRRTASTARSKADQVCAARIPFHLASFHPPHGSIDHLPVITPPDVTLRWGTGQHRLEPDPLVVVEVERLNNTGRDRAPDPQPTFHHHGTPFSPPRAASELRTLKRGSYGLMAYAMPRTPPTAVHWA